MQKIQLVLICLTCLCGCNSDQSQTTAIETNGQETTILKDGKPAPLPTDSVETPAEAIEKNQLIVPGKSVGLLKLNEQAEVVYKLLGKPDESDAAMGKMLATWFTKPKPSDPDTVKYQTNIFFARNMGSANENAMAKQIRVTAPAYKLENGVGIGSDLKTVQAHFPDMEKAASFTKASTKEPITVHLDISSGIAFEINNKNKCVGIGIQEPGKANFEVYTALSTDLKRL